MNITPNSDLLQKLSSLNSPDEMVHLPFMFENETRPTDGWLLMTFSGKSPFLAGSEICFTLSSQVFTPNETPKSAQADWTLFLLSASKDSANVSYKNGICVAKNASCFGPTIIPPGVWRLVAKRNGSGSIHSIKFRVISPTELEHDLAKVIKSDIQPEMAISHVKEILKNADQISKTTTCTIEAKARGDEQSKQLISFQLKLDALLNQTKGCIRFPAQAWNVYPNGDILPLNIFVSKNKGEWAVTDWTEPATFGRSGVFWSNSAGFGVKESDENKIKQAFHIWIQKTKYPPKSVFWRFRMPPVYAGDDASHILDQKLLAATYETSGSTSTETSTKALDVLGLVAIGVSLFFPPAIIVAIACTVISASAKIGEKSEAGFSGFWDNRFEYLAIALSGFAAAGKVAGGLAKLAPGAKVLVNTGTKAQAMFSILETGTNAVNVLLISEKTWENLKEIHNNPNLSPIEKVSKLMETAGIAILAGTILYQQFRALPNNIRVTLENPNARINAVELAAHKGSTNESVAKLAVHRVRKLKSGGGKGKKSKPNSSPRSPQKMNELQATDALRSAKIGNETPFAQQLAKLSLHTSKIPRSRLVLGRWQPNRGGYIAEAENNGGVWYETYPTFFDRLKKGIPAAAAETKAWKVNAEVLLIQLKAGIQKIEIFGETIAEVLLNRPNSFTAKEINFIRANAVKYGYTEVSSGWIKTGAAP